MYSVGLGALLAFGFMPAVKAIGIIEMRKGMNIFYVFLIDVAIAYIAYGMSKLVLAAQRSTKSS
ncbi:hypothetical protein ACP26L_05490 [Paenibacillus sp. S-38]|uniref:hypothetical protein n=1 Tax=Paenibacillus sp. S-38 TaxID=3416710 RepID=UPI003CE8CFD2